MAAGSRRWQEIEELYHAALERTPSDRARLLARADPETRAEVESLLAERADVVTLMESPWGQPRGSAEPLAPGTQVGPYKIDETLGVGGMGRVYRAVDTRLGRTVALKIAHEQFGERFEREARTIAQLNHPHICALYDVGPSYLVMEHLQGETLERRLRKGPLPLESVLRYGAQIADALAAAHARGIVHRDLKPSNIMVTSAGIKVLDFGLAKMETDPALTQSHVIVGTPAYMAPEQRDGKQADARTDIYALGLVLQEMATGGRSTPMEGLPPQVVHVIQRCIALDSDDRWQTASDVKRELEWVATASSALPGWIAPSVSATRKWKWVSGLLLAFILALASWVMWRPSVEAPELRLEIATPPTTDPTSIALSPDGKLIVFVATTERQSRLWVRPLSAVSAKPLTGTENATVPFWSPDSHSVGFAANGQLKRVDVESGIVRVLAPGGALGGAWNRDGTILFDRGPGSGLFRVSADGGEPRPVTRITPEANDHFSPQFLPDHHHYLFFATGTAPGIYGGDLQTSESPQRIVDAQSAAYASSGHLLFVRTGTLFAQAFDPVRLELAGSPVVVAEHILGSGATDGTAALSASAAGPFVYRTGTSTGHSHFVWVDRSGAPQDVIPGSEDFSAFHSALSRDESRLALSRTDRTSDIWVLDVRRGVSTRLTSDPAFDLTPEWSPDGRRIAFTSNRRGASEFALYLNTVDGTANDELLVAEGLETTSPNDWSADGRYILYVIGAVDDDRDILALPLEGGRKPLPVAATSFNETNGQFSPDGRWIAFQSDESGQFEIYVQPFLRRGEKVRISTAGGVQARWRRDGQELFFLAPDQRLMAVPIRLDSQVPNGVSVGMPTALFTTTLAGNPQNGSGRHYMVSRDGQRFLMQTLREVTIPITVVFNWKPKP